MSRRRILLLAGVLPALLALAFASKVGLMLSGAGSGQAAYADDRYDAARSAFAGLARVNLIERWVAPYDEGTAAFRQQEFDAAVDLFEQSLTTVPDDEECRVRVNLALSHEALGDLALESDDLEAAGETWERARAALGDCPDLADDQEPVDPSTDELTPEQRARQVDDRVEQKLQEQGQDPEDPPPPDQNPPPPPDREEKERQEKLEELEQRNDQARQLRQESDDADGYNFNNRNYQW